MNSTLPFLIQRNISHNIACRYSCCFQEYILFGLASPLSRDPGIAVPGSRLTGLRFFHVIAFAGPTRLIKPARVQSKASNYINAEDNTANCWESTIIRRIPQVLKRRDPGNEVGVVSVLKTTTSLHIYVKYRAESCLLRAKIKLVLVSRVSSHQPSTGLARLRARLM